MDGGGEGRLPHFHRQNAAPSPFTFSRTRSRRGRVTPYTLHRIPTTLHLPAPTLHPTPERALRARRIRTGGRSPSLSGPADPSSQALSQRLKFTDRRHESNKASFSLTCSTLAGRDAAPSPVSRTSCPWRPGTSCPWLVPRAPPIAPRMHSTGALRETPYSGIRGLTFGLRVSGFGFRDSGFGFHDSSFGF